MSEIKRLHVAITNGSEYLSESESGYLVRYDDHTAEVARLNEVATAYESTIAEQADHFSWQLKEVARLNEQVRALAAENLQARNSVSAFSEATIDLTEVIGDEIGMDGVRKILAGFEAVGNMTATDAILNEVRARAVDAYCDEMDRNGVVTPRDFAARIRAGEVPDA